MHEKSGLDFKKSSSTKSRSLLRLWLPSLIAVILLGVAIWVLHHELKGIHYRDVSEAFSALPGSKLLLAFIFCLLNYLALTSYDQLGFLYIGQRLARRRIALTAFVSYAVSNNVGFALLSGTAVRHRFYTRWGVPTEDFTRIVVFNAITYWLGLLALAGYSLIFHVDSYLSGGIAQSSAQWLGIGCMLIAVSYLLLPVLRKDPLMVRGFQMKMPSVPLAVGQLVLSILEWILAAAVLFILLPEGGPSYGALLGAFLAAQVIGIISHVPGGIGVFEGIMVLLLAPYLPSDDSITALLLYRLIYYVVPLVLALLILVGDELRNHRARFRPRGKSMGD